MSKPATRSIDCDVCIYAATPSGILAAIAAKRAGRSVVIVEPSRWVGGMLGAGLKPIQDCPNLAATGGLTRGLLESLGASAPKLEHRIESAGHHGINPFAVREDFLALLQQHRIEVVFNHRIQHCEVESARIQRATFELAPFDAMACPIESPTQSDSLAVRARMYIDASYEGDLMPAAGVSFRVGREGVADFDEPLAGVRQPMEIAPISPFVRAGDPSSGLLKWVSHDHHQPLGTADDFIQAYNYRYYTTSDPAHRAPIDPPDDYDALDFELVGRYVEHLSSTHRNKRDLQSMLEGICPGWMNWGEWNYQRDTMFSISPLGVSQMYANGDHATKSRIWKLHQDYLRGLFTFMRTDDRVPGWYRDRIASLGLDLRVHPDTHGWPNQLYIRVARRLKGRYTISAHDVYNRTRVDDPIGLAQYGIDVYPTRRIWGNDDAGRPWVGIEGKMFIGGDKGPTNRPYPVPYRAITPEQAECENLLVSVCFSATHQGYASARMEPVFMIAGESAGIAASLAIEAGVAVQSVPWKMLKDSLERAGQCVRILDC